MTSTLPRTFAVTVPATDAGIICGLCSSANGFEIRHGDLEDVATCAALRYERMDITGDSIPGWLVAAW